MMNEIFDMITLGMSLDFDGDSGMVCHKAIRDNRIFVNIAFDEEDGKINYKVFEVTSMGDNIKFSEVYDEDIKSRLTSYWIAEDMEVGKEV